METKRLQQRSKRKQKSQQKWKNRQRARRKEMAEGQLLTIIPYLTIEQGVRALEINQDDIGRTIDWCLNQVQLVDSLFRFFMCLKFTASEMCFNIICCCCFSLGKHVRTMKVNQYDINRKILCVFGRGAWYENTVYCTLYASFAKGSIKTHAYRASVTCGELKRW